MYCTKCRNKLINNECYYCIDKLDLNNQQDQFNSQNQDNEIVNLSRPENIDYIIFSLSVLSLIISIIPLFKLLMIFGWVLATFSFSYSINLFKKNHRRINSISIVFSLTAILSLIVWLYFIFFVIDKI